MFVRAVTAPTCHSPNLPAQGCAGREPLAAVVWELDTV
jgi:hypothetical protein